MLGVRHFRAQAPWSSFYEKKSYFFYKVLKKFARALWALVDVFHKCCDLWALVQMHTLERFHCTILQTVTLLRCVMVVKSLSHTKQKKCILQPGVAHDLDNMYTVAWSRTWSGQKQQCVMLILETKKYAAIAPHWRPFLLRSVSSPYVHRGFRPVGAPYPAGGLVGALGLKC